MATNELVAGSGDVEIPLVASDSALAAGVSFAGVNMAVNADWDSGEPFASSVIDAAAGDADSAGLPWPAWFDLESEGAGIAGTGADAAGWGAITNMVVPSAPVGITAAASNCFFGPGVWFAPGVPGAALLPEAPSLAAGEPKMSIARTAIGVISGAEAVWFTVSAPSAEVFAALFNFGSLKVGSHDFGSHAGGLPNIERIIASAICAGDALFAGVFAASIAGVSSWGVVRPGELRNKLMTWTKAGVVRTCSVVTGAGIAASRLSWLIPVAESAFTGRTNAGQCPKTTRRELSNLADPEMTNNWRRLRNGTNLSIPFRPCIPYRPYSTELYRTADQLQWQLQK
jgi:hypothetical protein